MIQLMKRVQQLCDVVIQLLGQRGDVVLGIGRCNGVRCACNGHSHFVYHVVLTLRGTRPAGPVISGRFQSFPGFPDVVLTPCGSILLRLFHYWRSLSPNYPPEPAHSGANAALISFYYNINSAREKVLFLNFWHICQKHCQKNVRYGKNGLFFLQSTPEAIIISVAYGYA